MTRIRKEPNRYWSKEDKLKLINEVLNGKSSQEVARENDISGGLLRNWIIKYNQNGEQALINKKNLVILWQNNILLKNLILEKKNQNMKTCD